MDDLAPAVAARRLFARLVVVEAHHLDVAIRLPLDELEGARADPLGCLLGRLELLGDLLGIDGRGVVGDRERDDDDGRLLLDLHLHRVLVDGPHRGHPRVERLAIGRLRAPAIERGHHVGGGHLLTVVELDALTQLEGVSEPVLRHRRHGLGEHGSRLRLGVQRVEALVDVVGQHLGDGGRRPVRVQRGRLAQVADLEDSALLLSDGLGRAPRDQRGRHERG